MFMPLCPLLIFVLDHICMPANIYIFVYSICVFVCVCVYVWGVDILSRTPLHNNQKEDEMKGSEAREKQCVYRREA